MPRYWPVEVNGLRALAIERFDRTGTGSTVFMESMYSIFASGSKTITNNYSANYNNIGQALDSSRLKIVDDRKAAKLHLLERLILAMITGNGDLHLENLSILDRDGVLAFSPVYDPTPMRAYKIHNMLCPPGMSFGNYGELPDDWKGNDPIDFSSAMTRFIKLLGISKKTYINTVERLMAVTVDYSDRVNALLTLPQDNKDNLIRIHHDTVHRFKKHISSL